MGIKKFYQKPVFPGFVRKSAWGGIATISSGSTTVTVSAAQVKSGSPPLLSLGATSVASHRKLVLSCNSIVDNTSFAIVSDLAPNGGDQEVVFMVLEG